MNCILCKRVHLSFLISTLMLSASCGQDDATVQDDKPTANSIEEIINDMKFPHEAIAHGTEQYDWGKAPRIGMGNDPGDWTAMITWGQVYESVKGNMATNTRVELRNIAAYYLSKKDGKWHQWQYAKEI